MRGFVGLYLGLYLGLYVQVGALGPPTHSPRRRPVVRRSSTRAARYTVVGTRKKPSPRVFARALMRNPSYEVGSAMATVISCGAYALSTLDMPYALRETETVISAIFLLEWCIRWYARGDLKYLVEPLSIIDLLSSVPLLAEFIDGDFRFLRLHRNLRFHRYLVDSAEFKRFRQALMWWEKPTTTTEMIPRRRRRRRRQQQRWGKFTLQVTAGDVVEDRATERVKEETLLKVARVVTTVFTLLFVASGCIFAAEHDVNGENFPDFFSALYFGLTTLTTVGFGDIVPITAQGRLVVSLSILVGIAVIPAQVTSLAEAILVSANMQKNNIVSSKNQLPHPHRRRRMEDPKFCSQCGARLDLRD